MSNEYLKKQCKDLADTLYEFSGSDFTQQHIQMKFTRRLHIVLQQMQSMGVLVINPDMNLRTPRGAMKGVFSGITFDNVDGMPEYIYQSVQMNGEQL